MVRIWNLKWREMRPFWKKKSQTKVAYWSEMARNAIESDFRSSKMAAGSHFVKKIKTNKSCVFIWNGQKCDRKWFSVIQNGRRQPFCEQYKKDQSCVLIWNGEECDRKWFSVTQNGRRQPFCEKKSKTKLRIDLKWRKIRSKVIFGHPKIPDLHFDPHIWIVLTQFLIYILIHIFGSF